MWYLLCPSLVKCNEPLFHVVVGRHHRRPTHKPLHACHTPATQPLAEQLILLPDHGRHSPIQHRAAPQEADLPPAARTMAETSLFTPRKPYLLPEKQLTRIRHGHFRKTKAVPQKSQTAFQKSQVGLQKSEAASQTFETPLPLSNKGKTTRQPSLCSRQPPFRPSIPHKKRARPSRDGLKKTAATYSPTCAVPSALAGLTSLFGMGRGGTPQLSAT